MHELKPNDEHEHACDQQASFLINALKMCVCIAENDIERPHNVYQDA